MQPKYPNAILKLSGGDGNAASMIGRGRLTLRRAGAPNREIERFTEEAESGDYDNVIQTCMKWMEVQ
jgi:hypothetical protein